MILQTEIKFKYYLEKFRECYCRFEIIVCYYLSGFLLRLWLAHRTLDTTVAIFQTLIDSIEDPDEKDRILCEYRPRMKHLKDDFSENLEYLRCQSGGGNHPLGVPRTNQFVLRHTFSSESTIKERLKEFDFMYARAWYDCTTGLGAANHECGCICSLMADTQKAFDEARDALYKLLREIPPEETERVRLEYRLHFMRMQQFDMERVKLPWNQQSASSFSNALIQEMSPEILP
jgi:hypothetical protein